MANAQMPASRMNAQLSNQISLAGRIRRSLAYNIRALFNRADTGVLAAGDLETQAPGSVQNGSIIIDDTSTGTVEVLGNELKCVGSKAWDTTGFHSPDAIARSVGAVIGIDFRRGSALSAALIMINNVPNILLANFELWLGTFASDENLRVKSVGGNVVILTALTTGVTYSFRFVLGGYDVNGVPGTTAAHTYGTSVYIKGGAFATYTLLWRTHVGNTANLYAGGSVYSASPFYYDNIKQPSSIDATNILTPSHLDTFTDVNGTNIIAHTPDVGGAAQVLSGGADIQGNQFNCTSIAGADVCNVVWPMAADGMWEFVVKQTGGNDSIIIRGTDATHIWSIQLSSTLLAIKDNQGAGFALRASTAITKSIGGRLRVIANGNTITAYYNDTQRITFTSTFNNTATLAGIRTTAIGNKVDNFAYWPVTDPSYDAALGSL